MKRATKVYVGATAATLVWIASAHSFTTQALKVAVPTYQVDASWPKPLPNKWVVGSVAGVAVDSKDNVYMIHRPKSQAGAQNTPSVLKFDPAGNLVDSWGSRETIPEWGTQEHGIYVDQQDNVWVDFGGGLPFKPKEPAEQGPEWVRDGWYGNAHVLKLSAGGKVLLEIGKFGKTGGSNSKEFLGGPTDVVVDPKTNEAFITDGYINRRVLVVDATTGAYKRHWGAYGKPPVDGAAVPLNPNGPPPDRFETPHCIDLSKDGLLYVCDRQNQRFQIFKPDGTFVKEAFIRDVAADGKNLSGGTVCDFSFSRDPQQRLLVVADIDHHKINIVDRESLQVVGTFGQRGRWAGNFESPHSVTLDSKGNLYVAETLDGRRLQKFVPKTGKATNN